MNKLTLEQVKNLVVNVCLEIEKISKSNPTQVAEGGKWAVQSIDFFNKKEVAAEMLGGIAHHLSSVGLIPLEVHRSLFFNSGLVEVIINEDIKVKEELTNLYHMVKNS